MIVSSVLLCWFFAFSGASAVLIESHLVESMIRVASEHNWGTLVAQIHADPATLELCSRELSSFNKQAAEIFFEHSNIETIQDAELVVNFYLSEGASRITWGLEGIDGIHFSRVPPSGLETSGDVLPSFSNQGNG